jgi:hypothetical protein
MSGPAHRREQGGSEARGQHEQDADERAHVFFLPAQGVMRITTKDGIMPESIGGCQVPGA